jgi:hypothetical protein
MAKTSAPFGFKPWENVLRARWYAVQTAPTINIMVQDLVCAGVIGIINKKFGLLLIVEDANIIPATPGDASLILGSVLECADENMDPISYIAAGRVGDGTTAGFVLVADHPDQTFQAEIDAAVTAANLDLHYEIGSPSLSAGNTTTGLSKQYIVTSGANTTNTIPLILFKQAKESEDTTAAYANMVCGINSACHYWASPTGI